MSATGPAARFGGGLARRAKEDQVSVSSHGQWDDNTYTTRGSVGRGTFLALGAGAGALYGAIAALTFTVVLTVTAAVGLAPPAPFLSSGAGPEGPAGVAILLGVVALPAGAVVGAVLGSVTAGATVLGVRNLGLFGPLVTGTGTTLLLLGLAAGMDGNSLDPSSTPPV